MEKSHTYGGVIVYPAPPQIESLLNSHFFLLHWPDLVLACAEQHQAIPQRRSVPASSRNGSEQGEGAPLEDAPPASEGLWRHPSEAVFTSGTAQRGAGALMLPLQVAGASGGPHLKVFPLTPVLRVDPPPHISARKR